MSQKKTTTQAQAVPAVTLTSFLTSPEMIQLVRDLASVSKAESSRLRSFAGPRVSSRLNQCKAYFAKATQKKQPEQPVTPLSDSWEMLESPAIARKLGSAQFEVWQHLNGVIETPDTHIHVQAYNMDFIH